MARPTPRGDVDSTIPPPATATPPAGLVPFDEALLILGEMFGACWTPDRLEAVLRHTRGNMDEACERILKHGDADPQLLLKSLRLSPDIHLGYGREQRQPSMQMQPQQHHNKRTGIVWCWKATPSEARGFPGTQILGEETPQSQDGFSVWIRYDDHLAQELELAHQLCEKQHTFSLARGGRSYRIDFSTMQQTDLSTGFQRAVYRWGPVHEIDRHSHTNPFSKQRDRSINHLVHPGNNLPSATTPQAQRPVTIPLGTPSYHTTKTQAHQPGAASILSGTPTQPLEGYPLSGPTPGATVAVATRDFAGDISRGQLSFSAGTNVLVLPGNESNGWRIGRCADRQGWFPVQLVVPAPSASTAHSPIGVIQSSPSQLPLRHQSFHPLCSQVQAHSQHPPQLVVSPEISSADILQLYDNNLNHEGGVRTSPAQNLSQQNSKQTPAAAAQHHESNGRCPENRSNPLHESFAVLSKVQEEIESLESRASLIAPNLLAELVTKICCRLDGVETHGDQSLRSHRKGLIQKAESIDPSNHSSPPAAAPVRRSEAPISSGTNTFPPPNMKDVTQKIVVTVQEQLPTKVVPAFGHSTDEATPEFSREVTEAQLNGIEQEINDLGQGGGISPALMAELVTKICCKLDSVQTNGVEDLRNRRKTLIQKAESLDRAENFPLPSTALSTSDILGLYNTAETRSPPPCLAKNDTMRNTEAFSTATVGTVSEAGTLTPPLEAGLLSSPLDHTNLILPSPPLQSAESFVMPSRLSLSSSVVSSQTNHPTPLSAIPSPIKVQAPEKNQVDTRSTLARLVATDPLEPKVPPPFQAPPPPPPPMESNFSSQRSLRVSNSSAGQTCFGIALAKYTFVGDVAQKQLSFPAGAKIDVLSKPESNGWMLGKFGDEEGWFPTNYVKWEHRMGDEGWPLEESSIETCLVPRPKTFSNSINQSTSISTAVETLETRAYTDDSLISDFASDNIMGGTASTFNPIIVSSLSQANWKKEGQSETDTSEDLDLPNSQDVVSSLNQANWKKEGQSETHTSEDLDLPDNQDVTLDQTIITHASRQKIIRSKKKKVPHATAESSRQPPESTRPSVRTKIRKNKGGETSLTTAVTPISREKLLKKKKSNSRISPNVLTSGAEDQPNRSSAKPNPNVRRLEEKTPNRRSELGANRTKSKERRFSSQTKNSFFKGKKANEQKSTSAAKSKDSKPKIEKRRPKSEDGPPK